MTIPQTISLLHFTASADISRLAKLYKTTVEHLTGAARDEPESESVRLLVQAAADISPTDGDEIRRFARFLRSTN